MKKSLFLAMVLMAIFTACSSEDQNPGNNPDPVNPVQEKYESAKIISGTTLTLRKVDFLTAGLGYIAGGNAGAASKAIILKTTDGGDSWSKVFEKDNYYITSIHALSATKVIAVTNNGLILNSENAGVDWTENATYKDALYMSDIRFKNENTGFIVGSNPGAGGVILITNDKGLTWQKKDNTDISLINGIMLNTIAFSGDAVYFSGGVFTEGVVIKGSGNGINWSKSPASPVAITTDVLMDGTNGFATTSNGVTNAALEKGQLLKTTDSGASWSVVNTGFDNKLEGIAGSGDNLCVIGSNKSDDFINPEFTLLSFNAGVTWQRMIHQTVLAGWEDVCFSTNKKAFLVGYNGLILKLTIK